MQNEDFGTGSGRWRSRLGQGIQQRDRSREDVLAWSADLTHDEDALTAELLNVHRDLRILEIPLRQPVLDRCRDRADVSSTRTHSSEERIRELSIVLHAEAARQLRLVEH